MTEQELIAKYFKRPDENGIQEMNIELPSSSWEINVARGMHRFRVKDGKLQYLNHTVISINEWHSSSTSWWANTSWDHFHKFLVTLDEYNKRNNPNEYDWNFETL